jgi:aspartyl-tRNA(Asn)/glutamyl-tRNA(Gln) amidotransferase subunit A
VLDLLEQHGAEVKVVSVPLVKYVLPYHYSLIPSEAASNLARFDGIRYGFQPNIDENVKEEDQSALFSYIQDSKTRSFGMNVKRRVMMGNFLMSSGAGYQDFNENLVNAQKYRRLIIE